MKKKPPLNPESTQCVPAPRTACLAGACPCPACKTLPIYASFTSSAGIPRKQTWFDCGFFAQQMKLSVMNLPIKVSYRKETKPITSNLCAKSIPDLHPHIHRAHWTGDLTWEFPHQLSEQVFQVSPVTWSTKLLRMVERTELSTCDNNVQRNSSVCLMQRAASCPRQKSCALSPLLPVQQSWCSTYCNMLFQDA